MVLTIKIRIYEVLNVPSFLVKFYIHIWPNIINNTDPPNSFNFVITDSLASETSNSILWSKLLNP